MVKLVLRSAFLLAPLTAAALFAFAGCSDETGGDEPRGDAGADTATVDSFVPPQDSGGIDSGKRDCKADKQVDGVQQHLDCAGLYSDFATKTVAAENKPYSPGLEFWSDGAVKTRFLYLPPGAKIDITDFDEWKFPNGTKIWKEFKLGTKRIETRLYFKADDGSWHHTVYRWNDAETDAIRKDNGEKVPVAGKPPYEVPNVGQCNDCHDGRTEPVLGIDAVSLGLPTAKGITLATLAADGRFSAVPPATSMTIPEDTTTKAAAALGWLHVNCGSCHNTNGSAKFTAMFFLLRPSQLMPVGVAVTDLDAYKTAVNVASTTYVTDAGAGFPRIQPGMPAESLVSLMSGRRVPAGEDPSSNQMPPIVTRLVDTAGHQLLDDWITALP